MEGVKWRDMPEIFGARLAQCGDLRLYVLLLLRTFLVIGLCDVSDGR